MKTKRTPIDPVCRMALDPTNTETQLEYQGHHLYFCSRSCLETFKAGPEQFGYGKRKGFWRRYLERLNKATAGQPPKCC